MQIEIIEKKCPITYGLPTKMTQQGFERSCREKQHHVVRTYKGPIHGRKTNPVCAICKGEKPAELEIVVLEEERMTVTTQPNDCPLLSSEEQAAAPDRSTTARASCHMLSVVADPWPEAAAPIHNPMGDGPQCSGDSAVCLRGEGNDAAEIGSGTSARRFAAFQATLGLSADEDGFAMLTAVAVLTQEFDRLKKRCADLAERLAAREQEIALRRSADAQAPPADAAAGGCAACASPV